MFYKEIQLMSENVIEFKKVSKTYKLYKNDKRRLLAIFF